jgi:hypothetical protein
MAITRDELSTLDLTDIVTGERPAHVTPGEVLRAEVTEPLGMSAEFWMGRQTAHHLEVAREVLGWAA